MWGPGCLGVSHIGCLRNLVSVGTSESGSSASQGLPCRRQASSVRRSLQACDAGRRPVGCRQPRLS
eukprot:1702078-Pyramimonas_sp.AAC.1